MRAKIFEAISASTAVKALIGTSPVRFYEFGSAPQDVAYPYAVWQVVGGSPVMYLDKVPDVDRIAIQVDAYAKSASTARSVADALRDAIEPKAYVTRWNGEWIDPETGSNRASFDVSWWQHR